MQRAKAVMHQVALQATKDQEGNYHFRPKSELWNEAEEELVFDKRNHGMNKQDYHLIEFVLDDQSGDELTFPEAPHDAMWVIAGAERANRQCPDRHSTSNYEVMEPICICDDRKRLLVRNDNPRVEKWSFTLNFVKRGEDATDLDRYVSWDPGGTNMNGGQQL